MVLAQTEATQRHELVRGHGVVKRGGPDERAVMAVADAAIQPATLGFCGKYEIVHVYAFVEQWRQSSAAARVFVGIAAGFA